MSEVGQAAPLLSPRQWTLWILTTGVVWAVAWITFPVSHLPAIYFLLWLSWGMPDFGEVVAATSVASVGIVAVPAVQALWLRRHGRRLWWWGPVTLLPFVGYVVGVPFWLLPESDTFALPVVSSVLVTLPGWLGQWLLLRRGYALPRTTLAVMLGSWTAAWLISFLVALFLGSLMMAGSEYYSGWTDMVPFFLALLLPGLIFGYGTGWPLVRARSKG